MTITIRDIAEKSGVSLATVSRVLNNSGAVREETREIVMKTIEELRYTPSAVARSLSRSETNAIGVIVPDINNPFFGEVIKGISSVADNENLNIILYDTDENLDKELKAIKLLKEQRIQGIIITPTSDENEFNSEHLGMLESLGTPIVLIDRDVKYSNFDAVFIDNIKGAYEATEAFIREGHKKIAIITGPMDSKPGRDRYRGYEKALIMNKVSVDPQYVFHGDFRTESSYKITTQILNMKDRPTAIFVCNNMMQLGVLKAINENNMKIPEDISIIGFDEIEILNTLGIRVSTVSRPTTEMGKVAMSILLDKLKEKNSSQIKRIILSPELKLKGSERLFIR